MEISLPEKSYDSFYSDNLTTQRAESAHVKCCTSAAAPALQRSDCEKFPPCEYRSALQTLVEQRPAFCRLSPEVGPAVKRTYPLPPHISSA